jgi:hypothetical protein
LFFRLFALVCPCLEWLQQKAAQERAKERARAEAERQSHLAAAAMANLLIEEESLESSRGRKNGAAGNANGGKGKKKK